MRFSIRTMLVMVTCWALLFAGAAIGYRLFNAPRKFTPVAWRVTAEVHRRSMARDFIAHRFHPGMSRAEVVALLGLPGPSSPQGLYYVIGRATTDYEVLWIRLDNQGKTVSATIYTTD